MSESQPEESPPAPPASASASWPVTIIVSVLIFAGAGGLAALTFMTEPTAQREGATKKTAMLVEVTEAERGTFRPQIVATGTVEAEQDIVLRPQVSGRVVGVDEAFTPGGYVKKGQTLVRLEEADYRFVLAQRESAVHEAEATLAEELGRQGAAQADYEFFGEELPDKQRKLILRKPQLRAAQQRVEAAKSAVDQARLDIKRTRVTAPFDAHVLERDVNVGSQVSPNENLGRLVGLGTYWVAVELPLSKLRWVAVPESEDEKGSKVRLRNRVAWPEGVERIGHIDRLVGALDEGTRMARLLVQVSDPLSRAEGNDAPPLIVGEFVEATVEGRELKDVVRVDRTYVRAGDTVWVMEDSKLRVKEVDVLFQDAQYAYVSSGLDDGAQVVTTDLSTVVDGAALRTEGEDTTGAESADE